MTTEKLEIYKCNICGNTVQVLLNGMGELVCCGEPMEKLEAQTENTELAEKHTPKIEKNEHHIMVTLKHHPMTKEHYIQFIQAYSEDKSKVYLKYLKPEDVAELDITDLGEKISAIELCNIHGLWRN